MKNWGLDQIGFTVVPTLIFDMTKAKALYLSLEGEKKEPFFIFSLFLLCFSNNHGLFGTI